MTPAEIPPADILAARQAAGLTQAQAAVIAMAAKRTWEDWERGRRPMDRANWAVFLHSTGQRVIPFSPSKRP